MFHTLGEMKNRIARTDDGARRARTGLRARSTLSRAPTASSLPRWPSKPSSSFCIKPTSARSRSSRRAWIPVTFIRSQWTKRASISVSITDKKLVLFVGRIEPLKGLGHIDQSHLLPSHSKPWAGHPGGHWRRSKCQPTGNDGGNDAHPAVV